MCQSSERGRCRLLRHPSAVRLIAPTRHLPLPPAPPIQSSSRGEEKLEPSAIRPPRPARRPSLGPPASLRTDAPLRPGSRRPLRASPAPRCQLRRRQLGRLGAGGHRAAPAAPAGLPRPPGHRPRPALWAGAARCAPARARREGEPRARRGASASAPPKASAFARLNRLPRAGHCDFCPGQRDTSSLSAASEHDPLFPRPGKALRSSERLTAATALTGAGAAIPSALGVRAGSATPPKGTLPRGPLLLCSPRDSGPPAAKRRSQHWRLPLPPPLEPARSLTVSPSPASRLAVSVPSKNPPTSSDDTARAGTRSRPPSRAPALRPGSAEPRRARASARQRARRRRRFLFPSKSVFARGFTQDGDFQRRCWTSNFSVRANEGKHL
ncbi:mucin-1-like [Columba livia]|uniref:mucin-1-like n=1 Tax=Columba livia TaxID=8932 RepID=UPI0031BA2B1B